MYNLIRAIALSKEPNSSWIEVDLTMLTPYEINAQFETVYIELSNPYLPNTVVLDFDDVRSDVLNVTTTFPEWLQAIGNRTLPTQDFQELSIQEGTVKYRDAVAAGYHIDSVDKTAHPDVVLSNADKEDLLLSKAGVDYRYMYDHALFTVNGMFHRHDHTPHGLRIVDGNRTVRHANMNTVGIHSFHELGKIQILDIDDSMLYQSNEALELKGRAYLDLGVDLTNKTVLLVLGGYLHVLDAAYKVIGGQQIRISFERISLVHRYLQSRDLIDLSSLGIAELTNGNTRFSVDDIYGDAAIRALINLPQSFIVLCESIAITTDVILLEQTKLPNRYVAHTLPEYPLLGHMNSMLEYIAFQEEHLWSIHCTDNRSPNYKLDTIEWKKHPVVDDTLLPVRGFEFTRARFLKITGTKLVLE